MFHKNHPASSTREIIVSRLSGSILRKNAGDFCKTGSNQMGHSQKTRTSGGGSSQWPFWLVEIWSDPFKDLHLGDHFEEAGMGCFFGSFPSSRRQRDTLPSKLTWNHWNLKIEGWKTIRSFRVWVYFQGRSVRFVECVSFQCVCLLLDISGYFFSFCWRFKNTNHKSLLKYQYVQITSHIRNITD